MLQCVVLALLANAADGHDSFDHLGADLERLQEQLISQMQQRIAFGRKQGASGVLFDEAGLEGIDDKWAKYEYKRPYFVYFRVPRTGSSAMTKALIANHDETELPIGICYQMKGAVCVGEKQGFTVMRDPFDRFASAVNAALRDFGHQPQIKAILDAGLRTPSDWADALAQDPYSADRILVEGEVLNPATGGHMVDGKRLEWKWPYSPQSAWIDGLQRPPVVLRFEHLQADLDMFLAAHWFKPVRLPLRPPAVVVNAAGQFSAAARGLLEGVYRSDLQLLRNRSKAPKLVFVHIPKNGGSAISKVIMDRKDLPIRICGHWGGAECVGDGQAVVVLRNPNIRFASAVNYAIKDFGHRPQIKAIVDAGMRTPEAWANALAGAPKSASRVLVEAEVENQNKKHTLDDKILDWKFTYSPQHLWLAGLKRSPIVLRFEHLHGDWADFLKAQKLPDANLTARVTGGFQGKNKWATAEAAPMSKTPNFSHAARGLLRDVYGADFQLLKQNFTQQNMCAWWCGVASA